MNVRVRLLRAHPARAMVESGVLALALTLPLAAILRPALEISLGPAAGGTSRWPILGLSMVYAGVFSAAFGAEGTKTLQALRGTDPGTCSARGGLEA